MAGRPTILTTEIQTIICDALRGGNTKRLAAESAGISYEVLREWVARGNGTDERPQTEQYVAFATAIKEAEKEAEAESVKIIRTAAQDSWQAAAWWLERRRSGDWLKTERVEHTGVEGGPIEVNAHASFDFSGLTDEQIEQLYHIVKAASTKSPESGEDIGGT
jgi:transposase